MRTGSLTSRIEALPWDTEHFGVKMGRLVLEPGLPAQEIPSAISSALEEARSKNFLQLMARAFPDQMPVIHGLEKAGFYLVDTLITLELDIRFAKTLSSDIRPSLAALSKPWPSEIREAKPEDASHVAEIARTAFADREVWVDRFHNDPHIQKEKADALYVEWAKNSIAPASHEERMADCTFVASSPTHVVGFLTCLRGGKRRSEPGKISLNAVDKLFRGHGIYTDLAHRALEWFKGQGTGYVIIRTSAFSQPVQRTWIRLGALPVTVEHTFHWWQT